jgi:hypothetical protein
VKSILRLLLVCTLLLALPFQAFASASMRLPSAQLPPCHQQAAQTVAMTAPMDHMEMDHKDHDGHAGQHAKGKCGSCAACCVGAALASGLNASLALAPPQFVSIPFRAGHLTSVDPVLPERPPSALLA